MLQTAYGGNDQVFEKKESSRFSEEKEEISSPTKSFSVEEKQALFYYINEEFINRFRLISDYYLKESKESGKSSDLPDFSDSFWVVGLKDIMEKNMKSSWFKKLPVFYKKQLEMQYEELTKLIQSHSKKVPPGIVEELFNTTYGFNRSDYLKNLKEYGFKNNNDFFSEFSNYNLSIAEEAASSVFSKISYRENTNYLNSKVFLEIAKILEKKLREGKCHPLEKMFSELKRMALQKNAEAQYCLGMCYFYGWGCQKNIEKAKEWLKKSTDQRDKKAEKALEQLFSNETI